MALWCIWKVHQKYKYCFLRWPGWCKCAQHLSNNSNVQHTTSKYFKCAAHHLELLQMCSRPPGNILNAQHTMYLENFKCAAHHLEIFQTSLTPPRNITRSDKIACTEDLDPVAFWGVASSRQGHFHHTVNYKGPRTLNLPGSVSLPRHLSRVYGFSTGWPSNRVHPCHQHWPQPWLSQGPWQALQTWPCSSHAAALRVILLLSYTQGVNAVLWFHACW